MAGISSVEAVLAHQAYPEADLIARQKMEIMIGGMAIRATGEAAYNPDGVDPGTFLGTIQEAAMGSEPARHVIEMNAMTDVSERLFKTAHQNKVCLKIVDKHLQQNGRKLVDIHRHSLENLVLTPEMLRRTKQEMHNALLFDELYGLGMLKTHNAVVFSPTPTAMPLEEKRKYNFFMDTESCSIQMLSVEGEQANFETAFVAGKATPGSPRHDLQAIQKLAERYGVRVDAADGTDMLQYVMLIPKEELPHGVVDMVRRYDDAAGGTFYGEAKPVQDYVQYVEVCEARNRGFQGIVDKITNQLIGEAAGFKTPLDAVMRLDELSERYSLDLAQTDKTINAAVFGEVAAGHLLAARHYQEIGEIEMANASMLEAKRTAVSGSCPLFKNMEMSGGGEGGDDGASSEGEGKKKWMHCPNCNARVFGDPCARVLSCWDCSARVVGGKVEYKGDGGSQRRAQIKAEHETERLAEQTDKAQAAEPVATSKQDYALAAG